MRADEDLEPFAPQRTARRLNERQLSQNWPAPLSRNAEGARFDEPRALFSGQKQVPLRGPVVVIKGGPCRRGRPCAS